MALELQIIEGFGQVIRLIPLMISGAVVVWIIQMLRE